MLKKTMTYVDFNGDERTEDFYFNLTEAEIADMELSREGGLSGMLTTIVNAKDQVAIINMFKEIVIKAYGHKSADGKHFVKNDAIREEFLSTQAYSDLFMELASDAEKAADFINGIVPNKMQQSKMTMRKMLDEYEGLTAGHNA